VVFYAGGVRRSGLAGGRHSCQMATVLTTTVTTRWAPQLRPLRPQNAHIVPGHGSCLVLAVWGSDDGQTPCHQRMLRKSGFHIFTCEFTCEPINAEIVEAFETAYCVRLRRLVWLWRISERRR
jgi:hypothetical protein